MSPEAQRIAIAEACGLNPQDSPLDSPRANVKGWFTPSGYDDYRHSYPHGQMVKIIPDYLSDLNAMHEAENFLTEEERDWYIQALLQNVSEETCDLSPNKAEWFITHATAAQRAEAFLRAKGLWKNT